MDIIRFCFQCPGRFSELLPEDLTADEFIIEDFVSQALRSLPIVAIVDEVEVDFFYTKNLYAIQIRICYCGRFEESLEGVEEIGLRIESLVGHSLLQLFWEVSLDSYC